MSIREAVKVKNSIYNTLRSFVESSESEEYHWNKGCRIGNEIVFTKYKHWVLVIKENEVTLFTPHREECVLVFHPLTNEMLIDEKVKWKFDDGELLIVPKTEVPFARPISIYEVLEKLEHYLYLVGGVNA